MKCKRYLLVVLLICLTFGMSATAASVKGIVKDKETGEPLSYVSVSIVGSDVGGLTDEQGQFSLETNGSNDTLKVFMVGYKEKKQVLAGNSATLEILLEEEAHTLDEVSVSAKNTPRYRNKDNPAVALIRQVIDNKDRNHDKKNTANYDGYEKLQVSLLRSITKVQQDKNNRNALSRLFLQADTTKVSGKAALPVVVHEKITRHLAEGNGKSSDTKLDEKQTSLDGIVDDNGLEAYLDKMYAATDVYDNNITLGDQQLLSPIAGMAPEFYKFFITDTLVENGKQLVKMEFYPRNKTDLLFKGDMLISLESYAVSNVNMTVNKAINLNWVDELNIKLSYSKSDIGTWYLQYSSLGMAMSILGKSGGFYGEKVISLKAYNHLDPIADQMQSPTHIAGSGLSDAEWETYRPGSLSYAEQHAYSNLDTLKQSSSFKRAANVLTLLLSGYETLGPVEVGPVNSFYSYNPVEGSRIKIGGRTTDKFSRRWMLEGHGAYGFKDKRWKYSAGVVYSLTGGPVAAFPMRNISLHRSFETQIPGQDLAFVEEDNFLLSLKRGDNDKWLYNNKWNVEYVHETADHLTFKAGFTHSIQSPAGRLAFISGVKETDMVNRENITLSEFAGEIRWAPHEQFYEGKKFRRPVFNSYPVFTLRGIVGVKGLMQSQYNYQSISLNIFKRFYLSQLGFSDVVLEGGRIFGSVPYPLLYIHKANQSYAYQLQSYNLMNFMEFVSDRYISLNIDHSFNGFFLNKIPLIKKLKLREVASFKALYGGLGNENMPGAGNTDLFNFPVNRRGDVITHSLHDGPYMEGSIGISNIFRVLRVDVIKRFSYLDNPRVTSWGVRARLVLSL
jgi:hypothetical protein